MITGCVSTLIARFANFLMPYGNWEALVNLKTDLDKNPLLPISEELKPLTKYFETFLYVSLVSFHLK